MKEFLEGRRLGFAPRPALASLALGLAIGTTLIDLMAWFAWGTRDTNGLVVAAYFLSIATALFAFVAALTALAEWRDTPEDESSIARLDVGAAFLIVLIYVASAALRSGDQGAAAASPAAFLLAIAGLMVLAVDGVIAGNLYATREWEEIEEQHAVRERRRAHAR